jgi:hypothetical protein
MDKSITFENVFCKGNISQVGEQDIIVTGTVKERVPSKKIIYTAASPPDYRASYTGSGLPFANQKQAFDNTPNSGTVELTSGSRFEIHVMFPNSYYVGLGTVIVPPTLFLEYENAEGEKRNISIKISDGIPYRLLTYPMQFTRARANATFYKDGWEMPVRTQEQVLRDSAYPPINKMPANFWGLKPPM